MEVRIVRGFMAASLLVITMTAPAGPASAQPPCDPNNGIGPDGGLPSLPPPAEAEATFIDLAQSAAPVDMVLDPGSGRLYVVERGANDVVVIDARADTPSIVGAAKVGERPTALALDETAQRLFVANGSSCSVSVLDVSEPTPTVLGTVASAAGPRAVAVDPDAGWVWTANWTGDAIEPIDGRADPPMATGESIVVGPGHVAAAIDPPTGQLLLLRENGLDLVDLSTDTVAATPITLVGASDVVTDGAGTAYVTQLADGSVSRIDLIAHPPLLAATSGAVAREPFDIRYANGLERLVVPSRSGEVLLLDPATLTVTQRVASSPALAAALVDEETGRLWMLDYTYHRVWSVPLPVPA